MAFSLSRAVRAEAQSPQKTSKWGGEREGGGERSATMGTPHGVVQDGKPYSPNTAPFAARPDQRTPVGEAIVSKAAAAQAPEDGP